MSIPELLKEGIMNEDWTKVNEAYTMLTGTVLAKDIPAPKPREEKTGNQFIDTGLHKNDTKDFDEKVWKGRTPTQRTRPEANKINVHCIRCHKASAIFPSELPIVIDGNPREKYICNNCSARGAR